MMELDTDFKSNGNKEMEIDSDGEFDIPIHEIDEMLEAGFEKSSMKEFEREKVILKVKNSDHFNFLPEDWIEVMHISGMPLYMHRVSRVCSVSKPYFLGPGSIRKHEIPISAIPCLAYLKALEKEKSNETTENGEQLETFCPVKVESVKDAEETGFLKQHETFPPIKQELVEDSEETASLKQHETFPSIKQDIVEDSEETASLKSKETFPPVKEESIKDVKGSYSLKQHEIIPVPKIESAKDAKESGSLNYLAVRKYCQRRFEFQTIIVKNYKNFSSKKQHQKQLKQKQMMALPDNTKLITFPLRPAASMTTKNGTIIKKEYTINPSGKTPVSLLHEYVQQSFGVSPKYIFKDLERDTTPFGAVMLINDTEYGSGSGHCKKHAKTEAAKAALNVLIPSLKLFAPEKPSDDGQEDFELFNYTRVEDPRIFELSIKGGQPYPYKVLLECLKRNYGLAETEVDFKMRTLKFKQHEFTMTVGKHTASVVCKTKRDGKHRASQAILQLMHPHISSWGSLLRMYGKLYTETVQVKKEVQLQVTQLQAQASANEPNMAVINKLKEEMLKHKETKESKVSIGKLIREQINLSKCDSNIEKDEL